MPLYGLAARNGVTAAKEHEASMQLPIESRAGRRRTPQVLRAALGSLARVVIDDRARKGN